MRAADRAAGRVAVDLLRDTPGIHVQQTSVGQGAVVLRGLVGNQLLLLVDGIPMNNGTYRDGPGQYLATIDPDAIERIEVVRGPASVAYGSDAQGVVVNAVTRPHPAVLGLVLGGARQGSSGNEGGRARLAAGYGTRTWQARLGMTLQQAGDLRAGEGVGRQAPTAFSAWGVDARLDVVPAASHQLTFVFQEWRMKDVPRYDRYWDFRAPDLGPDYDYRFEPQTRQLGYARHTLRTDAAGLRRLTTTVSLAVQREGLRRQRWTADTLPDRRVDLTRDDVFTPGLSVEGESQLPVAGRPVTLTWGAEGYPDVLDSRGERQDLATEKAMVRVEFLNPLKNFEKKSYDIEIRKDPLLGMTSVYNPNLRDKAKAFFGENDPNLIQRLVEESEKTCIFCGEKPEQGSPKYLPELMPEGRIKVGEAVLFANLFPLAQYHPVVSLCKTHFLSLSGFRPELLTNGFRAGQSFWKAVHDRDAGAVYATINMNYLFPAGASLVHPHLQMLIGPGACSYHARLADAAKVYYQTYGSSYFCDLIAEEEGRGSRLIGRTGRWHWMTAFSPMGSNEIMAVHEEEADAGALMMT